MKKAFLLLSLFYGFSVFAQQVVNRDDLVTAERNRAAQKMNKKQLADASGYDVIFQRLELTPDMNKDSINGIVTTYFKPVVPISFIEFDLADQLDVEQVTKNASPLSFTHTNNILHIDLGTSLSAGVLDSIQVKYKGVPPDSGFDSYVTTTHGANNVPVVWTLSEPYGARDWWPCKQDLSDKIDSLEVVLHYPENINNRQMKGVSNGLLISETVANGIKTSVWKSNYPIAAYLVAFAITDYETYSFEAGISQTFPVDNFFYPENFSTYKAQSDAVLPVMNFFEETYGLYPFNNEKYGQAQFGWGGGMEHQTITFLVNFGRDLMAHELAHQWFGDAVTCGSWHDIWLNEGFATYSEGLIHEALDGEADFINWKKNKTNYIISRPDGSVYVEDTTSVNRIFDYRLSYSKGAMVLNMLRLTVGDDAFFRGLKNYFNQKEFVYALTPDFKAVMEEVSAKTLDEFFDDWIYGEGYPTYTFTITSAGGTNYKIVVHQATSHPSVDFFEMPLPFTFIGENGEETEFVLENTENDQEFLLDLGMQMDTLVFDKKNDIVKGETILNLDLTSVNEISNDLTIYPNPAVDSLLIQNILQKDLRSVQLYDTKGSLIKHWLQPQTVLDISVFASGVYLISIKTEKEVYITKIMIKN